MQKLSVSIVVMSAFVISGCVSESTYVGSDRPVQQRQVDNTEAARTRMSLGLNYMQRGENAQAIYNLERARIMAPQLPEVYNALAYYYQSVGENEQAEAAYQQALARDPDNADTYNNYGAFLCQIDKFDEAERLLLSAIRRPGYMRVSESYENLALCSLDQDKFSRAHNYLESSVLHSSNRISSLLNLAALEYAMGNHQSARQHLTRIQRLGHVSASTSLLTYLIADKELNDEVMKTSRELLLQVYPDSEAAQLMLHQRLQQTEYEQLRERYKRYLISRIELPAETSSDVAKEPDSQPQIRVVRRRPAAAESSSARPASVPTVSESMKSEPRPENETSVAHQASELTHQANESTTSSSSIAQEQPVTAKVTKTVEDVITPQPALEFTPIYEELVLDPAQTSQANSDAIVDQETASTELPADAVVNDSSSLPTQTEPLALAELENELSDVNLNVEQVISQQADLVQNGSMVAAEPLQERQMETVPQHIVQQGESLFSISVLYNIRLERLLQWNNLTPEAVIRSGQRLWLAEAPAELVNEPEREAEPLPEFHVVARGDTLFSISMFYNVRLSRLLQWNNLTEQSRVYVGQQIYLSDPANLNHDD